MENRYFVIEVFAEGSVDAFLSNKAMTFDDLLVEYMQSFKESISPDDAIDMSDEELEDEINMWEHSLDEADCGYVTSVKVYELDTESFSINLYSIPLSKMVEHVKQWAKKKC